MEKASHAFLDAVRKSMRQVRAAVGSTTINPDLLTAAERIQYHGYLRREDTNSAILRQAGTGVSIKEIVRLTGHSRGLFAGCSAVSDPTSSGFARVRLRPICLGSTHGGLLVSVTALPCGVASRRGDLGAHCGSSQNGRHVVDAPKRLIIKITPPPEPSPGS